MKSSPWHASTNELGKAPACSTGTRHTRGCKFTSWHILILHCSTQETFTFQMNVVQVQPQKCLVQFECSSRLEKA
jgi:hypothetical protein